MNMLSIITSCCIVLVVSGCATPHEQISANVRYPKRPKFHLSDRNLAGTISSESKIYIRTIPWNRGEVRYEFLRLWPTGEAFLSHMRLERPSKKVVESIDFGDPGYYHVSDGRIKLELFSGAAGGTYQNYYGQITEERIILRGPWRRGTLQLGTMHPMEYDLADFKELVSEPPWRDIRTGTAENGVSNTTQESEPDADDGPEGEKTTD